MGMKHSQRGNNCFTNGFQSEILPHGKVKLVDEYLFEGIQIVLLVEDEHRFLVVDGVNRTETQHG